MMQRRRFLLAGLAVPVSLACGAERAPSAAQGPNPPVAPSVPETPVSYVTATPPPLGERLTLDDATWRTRLTRRQFAVLREHDTELPYSSRLHDDHGEGRFMCAGCGAPLFASRDKFDSGTGWPSFTRPIEDGRVGESRDTRLGTPRVEVHCARCDGHLGHVFDDGPPPTGQRYCINGICLELVRGA